jgi:fibronectin-binding autotransporter adhesin
MTRKHFWLRPVGWLPILALLQIFMAAAPTKAQTIIDWNDPLGGAYNDTNNWTGLNVPDTVLESARFNIATSYNVVHLSGTTTTVSDLLVNNGAVTFASSGGTFATYVTDDDAIINGGDLILSGSGGVILSVSDRLTVLGGSTFSVLQGTDVTAVNLDVAIGIGDGTLIVDGAGSSLIVSTSTDLGFNGNIGTLTFQNGSTGNGLNGTVDVMAGSGVAGSTGRLNVLSGSTLQTGSIDVGRSSSATNVQEGTLTVDGAGSTLTMTGSSLLTVGDDLNPNVLSNVIISNSGVISSGTGAILIRNSGHLNISSGTFNANGNVNLDGGRMNFYGGNLTFNNASFNSDPGTFDWKGGVLTLDNSTWSLSGELVVGSNGDNETLNILNGGQVSNTTGRIGFGSGSIGVATVDGVGSTWTNSGSLYVGQFSGGNGTLTITGGGQVSNGNGYVAGFSGSTGDVTVDGAGSTWTPSSNLYVGHAGAGTLAVTGGGQVSNATGYVAWESGSTGAVTVNGAGSTWTSSSGLYIGGKATVAGGTGSLDITNGGLVDVTGTTKLWGAGTLNLNGGGLSITNGSLEPDLGTFNWTGGTLSLDNSTWGLGGELVVGSNGDNETLNILNGGQVSNTTGRIGFGSGSIGSAMVDGAGSTWTNSGSLYVGQFSGGDGTLAVTGGGQVSSGTGYIAGFSGSTGAVTIDGIGSTWNNSNMFVGHAGNGTLAVTGGGWMSNSSAGYVGYEIGSTGAVTVDGIGSTWTNGSGLYIGGKATVTGGTGTLDINNGGLVEVTGTTKLWGAGTLNIGVVSGGTFNANGNVNVDGGTINRGSDSNTFNLASGLTLTATNDAQISFGGDYEIDLGTTFDIQSGADFSMIGGGLDIGVFVGNGTLVVDGAGSSVTSGQSSTWGALGNTADVTFRNGATGSLGGISLVNVAGGTTGNFNIESGAIVTTGFIGINTFGGAPASGTITVDGPTSSLTQDGASSLIVGNATDGTATINIQNGSTFNTGTGLTTINAAGTLNAGVVGGGTFNANGNVNVDGGTITRGGSFNSFNLASGLTLTATNDAQISFGGDYEIDQATTFDIQSGADFSTTGHLDIGNSGGDGTMIVDGAGSSVTTGASAFTSYWGDGGNVADVTFRNGATGSLSRIELARGLIAGTTGIFNVESGATVNTGTLLIAQFFGATTSGTITVDGNTSSLTQGGASWLVVGNATDGTATINVQNGGTFTTGTGSTTINAAGTLNVGVVGGGTFNANGDVNVDGGAINRGSDPNGFNLASGLTLTASNNAQINFGGDYEIDLGTTFDIQSGADFSTATWLDIGNSGGDGTLVVDGAGSSVVTGGTGMFSFWGRGGNTADVTFRNGATGSLGHLLLAHSSAAGTTGIFNVESGATVTTGTLDIAQFGGATTSGTITVDGATSSLTQDASSTLVVGHATSGTATINVQNGGTFNTGPGTTTIGATGTLNIGVVSGGTFNANGDVNIDGGTINRGISISGFNLASGLTLTASNDAQINFAGNYNIGQAATFDIQSGADFSTPTWLAVGAGGADGTLVVDGAGSSVTTGSASTSFWGDAGNTADVTFRNGATGSLGGIELARSSIAGTTGIFNVESGATVNTLALSIAPLGGATTSGTITVDGNTSSLTQGGASSLKVGNATDGTATINVQNGGTFNTGTGLTTINATGTLNIGVVGGGTFNANGNVNIDGGTINRGISISGFNLSSGLTLTASNNAQINFGGNYDIDLGTTFDIQSGADFSTTTWLNIGAVGGDGTLVVDGAGSSVTTGSASTSIWGDAGNTADVTFRNGATGSLGGIELVLVNVAGGTTSNFNIESGAIVTTGFIGINTLGVAPASGTITVDGPTSSLTQDGASSLKVGNATDGTATINIQNGGTFNTGTGTTTVNATGTVNVNSGTFSANGNVNLAQSGGTLNLNGGTFAVTNGSFDSDMGLYNWTGGTLSLNNSTWTLAGDLSLDDAAGETLNVLNGGLVSNTQGRVGSLSGSTGTVTVDGVGSMWTNSDSLYIGGDPVGPGGTGQLTVSNGGSVSAVNTVKLWSGGSLNLSNGTVTATTVDNEGTITGTGTLDANVTGSGIITPGFSPGILTINGNYDPLASGSLAIELAGNGGVPGTDFDQLVVTGTATLNGTLDLSVINPFTPTPGDTFPLLTAASRVGTFSNVTGTYLGGGFAFDVLYGAADVTLEVVTAPPLVPVQLVEIPITPAAIADPSAGADLSNARTFDLLIDVVPGPVPTAQFAIPSADASGDGFIGLDDLNIVMANMGLNTNNGAADGDLDGSGLVDIRDFAIVASQWEDAGGPGKGILGVEMTVSLSGGGTVYQNPTIPAGEGDFEQTPAIINIFPALEFDTYFPDWGPDRPIRITTGLTPATIGSHLPGALNESIAALRLTVLGLDASGEVSGRVLYEDGSGLISELDFLVPFAAQAIAGDLDGDGFVGIVDLNIVLGNWNQNVPPGDPLADPSGDGFVGIADLNVVLGNWNAGTPPGDAANIPEPSSLALLGLGALSLISRLRRLGNQPADEVTAENAMMVCPYPRITVDCCSE